MYNLRSFIVHSSYGYLFRWYFHCSVKSGIVCCRLPVFGNPLKFLFMVLLNTIMFYFYSFDCSLFPSHWFTFLSTKRILSVCILPGFFIVCSKTTQISVVIPVTTGSLSNTSYMILNNNLCIFWTRFKQIKTIIKKL